MAALRKADEIPEAGTVTVACNQVNGLVLQLYNMQDSEEAVLGGGVRVRKVAVSVGDPVTIRGPRMTIENQRRNQEPYYVLTPDVPADFMRRWMADNANTKLVTEKCVLVQVNKNEARAAAKDNAGRKSGFEPIIPGTDDKGRPNDLRIPRPLKTAIGSVGAIETSDIE